MPPALGGDSLGKKTHLAQVLLLFANARQIWTQQQWEPKDAARQLARTAAIHSLFGFRSWPFDGRAQQAYVHRFFGWLSLPPDQQADYPTVLLGLSDSVALRQCLLIDFVFGTPQARDGTQGLYSELQRTRAPFVLGPGTHAEFRRWTGLSTSDNTSRGPFARWLEDAGVAVAAPIRRANETTIVANLSSADETNATAFAYGLFREHCVDLEAGVEREATLTIPEVRRSLAAQTLLVDPDSVQTLLSRCDQEGLLRFRSSRIDVSPAMLRASVKQRSPYPAPSWLEPEDTEADMTFDQPLDLDLLGRLRTFPSEPISALSGSPFGEAPQLAQVEMKLRDSSFAKRVAAAYRNGCLLSGTTFRSPNRTLWYGEAAHIVPHSGRDKSGSEVFGVPAVANGIFLTNFYHWCFDHGWLTLDPRLSQSRLSGYTVSLSSVAADGFFSNEYFVLESFDKFDIPPERLPFNTDLWPSPEALDWHKANVFAG